MSQVKPQDCQELQQAIAIAVKQGKYKGRKEVKIDNFAAEYELYRSRELNKAQLAAKLDISRPTLDKLIKEHERCVAT